MYRPTIKKKRHYLPGSNHVGTQFLLFVWVGNETFAHWRQLPGSLWAGCAGLDIGLVGPVARGASRFENLLAPQKTYWPGGPVDLKTYWPPKKLTGPYLKTKLARRKTICINLQFAHRPIIKLFRSHPRNNFQI